MQNEIKNDIQTSLIPATTGNSITSEIICDARCRICHSEHLEAIHNLKKAGHTFLQIADIMRTEHKFEISKSSLSRHFQNYQHRQAVISAKMINGELIEDATKQAAHTRAVVELIDIALQKIRARMNAGTINLDVSDLERLIKLRYQVLTGKDEADKDIMAIFQKATDKYGVSLNQGVLFGG